LKARDEQFPERAIREAGYHAVWRGEHRWNGVAILSRGGAPVLTRRSLPGDAADKQSRYIEAAVDGVLIACLYLPNGNPQPGPKFDYKLAWFDRLKRHALSLVALDAPVVLAGDYNLQQPILDEECAPSAREPGGFRGPVVTGMDGRGSGEVSGRPAALDLLAISSRGLGPRRGPADRPPSAERSRRATIEGRRRRSRRAG
jgi:hypothetical protein